MKPDKHPEIPYLYEVMQDIWDNDEELVRAVRNHASHGKDVMTCVEERAMVLLAEIEREAGFNE